MLYKSWKDILIFLKSSSKAKLLMKVKVNLRRYRILLLKLHKAVSYLISSHAQVNSQKKLQDTSSNNFWMVSHLFIRKVLPTEISSLRILCLVLTSLSRLLILVLLVQLMEEMDQACATPTWVPWTIWLQKFIWAKTTMVNLLISSLLQSSCSLWFRSIHHSLQLNQMTHSIDA